MVKELKTSEFEDSIASGVNVLKVFTKSCVPCKMISPAYEKISEECPDVCFYSVDAEEEWELNAKLDIMSVPTIIVFKDGVEQARDGGMIQRTNIEALLEGI